MQSFSDVLNLVKDYFQQKVRSNELTETAYRCWIQNIEPDRFENNTAYLTVSSPFYRGILIDQYLSQLKEAFESVLGFPVNVEILCGPEKNPRQRNQLKLLLLLHRKKHISRYFQVAVMTFLFWNPVSTNRIF